MTFSIIPSIWIFIHAFFNFHATFGQFPDHLDFQKVDVIMLNNQKYNVLKPTVHLITDYFEQFIQKRQNTNIPSERLFIDENGFRHYWRGMNIPSSKRSRKTDKTIKENNSMSKETNIISSNDTKTDRNKNIKNFGNTETDAQSTTTTTTVRLTPRRKKKRLVNHNFKSALRQGVMSGTVVKTSFFCPFMGVITMTLNADEL